LEVSKVKPDSSLSKARVRENYIENVEPGTILAFKMPGGEKVRSAAIVNRSSKNRKLKVVTSYGVEYVISYDDVVWVRTGKRWPRGVYNLLKGIVEA